MLQLSKIKQSRDEWRDKAKKRAKELWEMRKVHKYYKDRVAKLVKENDELKIQLKESSIKDTSNKKNFINYTK